MSKVLRITAVAGMALALAAPAFAAGGNTGYGQTCDGSAGSSPQDSVSGYDHSQTGLVGVATTGGAGVEIGTECGGGVGRASVSTKGVYAEDYTEGDQIASVVRSAPEGTVPADSDCPPENTCDTVRVEP